MILNSDCFLYRAVIMADVEMYSYGILKLLSEKQF